MDLFEPKDKLEDRIAKIMVGKIPKDGIVVFKIGDRDHEPTEEMVNRAATTVKSIIKNKATIMVMPYWIDVEIIKPNKTKKVKEK